jgi:dihydrolipoamide dehydrogenase
VGRTPNGKKISAEKAGVAVTDRGFIHVDIQMRTNVHKELAAAAFNARVIPSVAYTDPEVAWVGLTEDQAKAQGIKVKKGLFPWAASGHAVDIGKTIHPHPMLGESIGMAAEIAHGSCTDVPPARK